MLPGPQRLAKSGSTPKQLVVFFHGYGSNGNSLIKVGDQWAQALPDAEFIAPHGLEPLDGSASGYRWFKWIDFDPANVRPGLEKSAPVLAKILTQWLEERKLSPKDLALVGFSQGTMVALELMFHIPGIRAIIGYSGAFYPPSVHIPGTGAPSILLVHGDADTGVPYSAFIDAGRQLKQLGITPQLETRPGGDHRIDQVGIEVGMAFLRQQFSDKAAGLG